jgi:hypothetical protein
MNTKENFKEMVAYDFSNLNLQQKSNDNCFTCDDQCDGGDGCYVESCVSYAMSASCDVGCDFACDDIVCDTCDHDND